MKQIFYLCGIPRAGNTLFASIMNQNTKVAVTANSIVADMFCGTALLKNYDTYNNFPDEKSLDNVIKNIMQNYYSEWKADYIIDRSVWGFPENFEILKKYFTDEIKIIVLVRDLKEVLASFIKFSYMNDDNYIAKNAKTLEERCDYIMLDGGALQKWIQSVYNLTRPENKQYTHLIEYNDLVNDTKTEIDKVYDYLGIEKFDHKFNNLSQLENNDIKYDDSMLGGELHKVKENKVEKSDYDIYDYLPKDVDTRYKLDKFW